MAIVCCQTRTSQGLAHAGLGCWLACLLNGSEVQQAKAPGSCHRIQQIHRICPIQLAVTSADGSYNNGHHLSHSSTHPSRKHSTPSQSSAWAKQGDHSHNLHQVWSLNSPCPEPQSHPMHKARQAWHHVCTNCTNLPNFGGGSEHSQTLKPNALHAALTPCNNARAHLYLTWPCVEGCTRLDTKNR